MTKKFYEIEKDDLKKLVTSEGFIDKFIVNYNLMRGRITEYEDIVHQNGEDKHAILQAAQNEVKLGRLPWSSFYEILILHNMETNISCIDPETGEEKSWQLTHPVELAYLLNNEFTHHFVRKYNQNIQKEIEKYDALSDEEKASVDTSKFIFFKVPPINLLVAKNPEIIVDFEDKMRKLKDKNENENYFKSINSALCINIYSKDEVKKRLESGTIGNEMLQQMLKKMIDEPGIRVLKTLEKRQKIIKQLKEDFPNFTDVIDKINMDLVRNGIGMGGPIVKFSPILLRGEPGIGKTEFARRLSELMNVHTEFIDLSINSSPHVLGGLSSSYKDSKPGEIYTSIMNHEEANLILFLDEIDKVGSGAGTGERTSLNSLYSLLENSSKKSFRDEFLGMPINTEGLNFIAAANDGPIPTPLLERFTTFHVAPPTPEQTRNIVKSIWRKLHEERLPVGHKFNKRLKEEVIDMLVNYKPRAITKIMEDAVSYSLISERVSLTENDVVNAIEHQKRQNPDYFTPKAKTMGFLQPN